MLISILSRFSRYGAAWAMMLKDEEDGIGFDLRARNNVQLKDRARILKKHYIKEHGHPGIWDVATD